jgi:tetratricopeptide (TPR) repeat protein
VRPILAALLLTTALTAADLTVRRQNLLAQSYILKLRETVDFSYLEKAAALVESVLLRDPGNYDAQRLRAEIDMERHEFARVAEVAEEMTRFVPNDPANWGTLGDASMELGRYETAGAAYAKMQALRPNLSSYNRLAWYEFVHGRVNESLMTLKNAIAAGNAKPQDLAWCWNDLGNIYLKTGHLPEAAEAFQNAVAVVPSYYASHAGLGRVQAAQKRWKQSIESFRRAQAIVPMPEFTAALEDLYAKTGNPLETRKQRDLLEAVNRLNQATGERTNRNLALVLADHDRHLDRAAELAENELKVRPDVYTWDAVAWVRYKQKRYPEAKAAADKALVLNTPEPAFYYHASKIEEALGNQTEAARLKSKIPTEFDPQFH